MHSEDERYYGLGMDALVILRTQMMRGTRSISDPRNTLNAWFVLRRPHLERSPAEPIAMATAIV